MRPFIHTPGAHISWDWARSKQGARNLSLPCEFQVLKSLNLHLMPPRVSISRKQELGLEPEPDPKYSLLIPF